MFKVLFLLFEEEARRCSSRTAKDSIRCSVRRSASGNCRTCARERRYVRSDLANLLRLGDAGTLGKGRCGPEVMGCELVDSTLRYDTIAVSLAHS